MLLLQVNTCGEDFLPEQFHLDHDEKEPSEWFIPTALNVYQERD
jgi:hypothetical protein